MDYFQTISRWYEVTRQIEILKAEELSLRNGLVAGTFPGGKEGSNNFPVPSGTLIGGKPAPVGTKLRATIKYNRSVDKQGFFALPSNQQSILVELAAIKLNPELSLTGYRALTGEPADIINTIITTKPGTPSLELVIPTPKKEKL